MMSEDKVRSRIEELKRIILDSSTKMNIREQSVNMLRAFEEVLQDNTDRIMERLDNAGITTNTGRKKIKA